MTANLSVSIGSGTLPHVGPSLPSISGQFPDGTYPVPGSRNHLHTITGIATVLINPEDFSVHIGLRPQAITVGVTAVALPAVPLEYRRALVIHNASSNTIYIGDSGVTTSNGLPLIANEKIAVDIQSHAGMTIYGIAGTGGNDVRILELA